MTTTPESTVQKKRVHPLIRSYYLARFVTNIVVLIALGIILHEQGRMASLGVLVAYTLSWPHLAYHWAKSYKGKAVKGELRNLVVDSMATGAWVAAIGLPWWPTTILVLGAYMMNMVTGGVRLWLIGNIYMAIGFFPVFWATGFHYVGNDPMSLPVQLSLTFTLMVYCVLVSYVVFNQVTDLIGARRLVKVKNAELEVMQQDLEVANADLEDFAKIVSHDLKAPLRGISFLARTLKEDYGEVIDEEGRKSLSLMMGRTERMQNLIQGILLYSKAGVEGELASTVDLGALVRDIGITLAEGRDVEVRVEEGMPTMEVQATWMEQIFQNLMSNGIKYSDKEKSLLQISCEEQEDHWLFRVADNGPGIDERFFEDIFKVFRTLQSRDQYESTGVGLSVVKKLVERMGGRIWVESTLGEGTTFLFTVPKPAQGKPKGGKR